MACRGSETNSPTHIARIKVGQQMGEVEAASQIVRLIGLTKALYLLAQASPGPRSWTLSSESIRPPWPMRWRPPETRSPSISGMASPPR
jgi:hypothetical protein